MILDDFTFYLIRVLEALFALLDALLGGPLPPDLQTGPT